MTHVVCQFSQLTQQFDTKTVFSGLSSTLTDGLTGLVGRNGQGKSVLLALLAQDFPPTGGSIRWLVPFYWVRQLQRLQGLNLADALGVGTLYDSFERIQSGEASAEDFAQVEDRWHLPALWEQELHEAGLDLPLSTPVQHLSGGEQTRLALCRAFLQPDHYLLLDEPSNHLDTEGRQWLLAKLTQHPVGALVAMPKLPPRNSNWQHSNTTASNKNSNNKLHWKNPPIAANRVNANLAGLCAVTPMRDFVLLFGDETPGFIIPFHHGFLMYLISFANSMSSNATAERMVSLFLLTMLLTFAIASHA